VVPGVRLVSEAPDADKMVASVIDEKWAEDVLVGKPAYPVMVLMEAYDHETECAWLSRGADACFFLTDDLKVRVPQSVERARARRTATNRVRKEDLRYRAMVDNLMEVVTLLDGFGVILHESPSLKEVFGWDPEEMIGRNSAEFVHPADVPNILKLIAEGREVPSMKVSTQYRFKHKNGGWRVVESKAVNLLHDLAVQSIVVVSRDVTERQEALDAMRASRGRLAALLNAIPDAYVLVDADGIYRDVHIPQGYPSMQPAEELIGMTVEEALPPELAAKAKEAIAEVLETGKPSRFDYSIPVAGVTRYREAQLVPFSDELVLSVQRDITDRIEALQRVRASETRFRTLFEESPDAIFLESIEGEVLDANPAACELHGCDRDWLIGKHVTDLVPSRIRKDVVTGFQRLVTGEVTRGEGVSLRKDGKAIPVEFSAGRMIYGDRDTLLLHVRDISQRRAQEAMIRKLATYKQSGIEQERARISREVHDVLGQYLTGLRFDVSRIGRKLKGHLSEEISATTAAIDAVIDDVRRIAAELRPGIIDDLGIGAAVEWQAKAMAKRLGLTLELHVDSKVELDPGRSIMLFRVFQELLTNVARHAEADTVAVTLTTDGDLVGLDVADDGRGIEGSGVLEDERFSLGLMGIRERLQPWSGTFELLNNSPRGTLARVSVPLESHADTSTHS
jgi:PAS domain S-box-containing protein